MDHLPSGSVPNNVTVNFYGQTSAGGNAGVTIQGAPAGKTDLELITSLKPIANAEWAAAGGITSGCLKGTRQAILKAIWDWYIGGGSTPPIYWLKGDSGTGKSAIMFTSCHTFAKKSVLGASFFFSRDQESRSKIDFVFVTLAYRLCFTFPQLRSHIVKALQDETLLASLSLQRQLQELILTPICREASSLASPIVIVIDALDECDGTHRENSIVQFINILASEFEALEDIPPLKFLVTSRPHEHLLRAFAPTKVKQRTNMLFLRDIEPSVQERDLRLFIEVRLQDLASQYEEISSRMENWPSEKDVSVVLSLSGGHFISAATLLRMMGFKEEEASWDPRRVLNRIRHSANSFGIDEVYREVLRGAARRHKTEEERRGLCLLLAFIVLSFDRLAARDIDALLNIQCQQFVPILRSVIYAPGGGGLLRAEHASFHDFMVDSKRCGDTPLNHIESTVYHLKFAKICVKKLCTLKRDLLDLGKMKGEPPTEVKNADVIGLINLIPKDLCYAVKYWPMHVASCSYGTVDEELLILLEELVKSHILHWVEALSYLAYLSQGIARLVDVMNVLKLAGRSPTLGRSTHDNAASIGTSDGCSDRSASVRRALYDIQRLVQEHYEVISQSALHLYYSALPFTPKQTDLHRLFFDSLGKGLIRIVSGIKPDWDACLQTIKLNSAIDSISISTDGVHIAAGTESGKVIVVDMVTGGTRWQMDGHGESITSIAFSTDGARIVSGSGDRTVRIWDSRTGEQLLKLEGHTNWVYSVAFSPDGARIVSGSVDRTIRIWDSRMGKQLLKLEGHTNMVYSVAFSPDGARVVSGSWDSTIRIWDSRTGEQLL